MANLRFNEGDLVEVSGGYRKDQWPYRDSDATYPMGPRIVGSPPPMKPRGMMPNSTFLVLSGSRASEWHTNRKLYVEVLTEEGPRTAWASNFKMKKGKLNDVSPKTS